MELLFLVLTADGQPFATHSTAASMASLQAAYGSSYTVVEDVPASAIVIDPETGAYADLGELAVERIKEAKAEATEVQSASVADEAFAYVMGEYFNGATYDMRVQAVETAVETFGEDATPAKIRRAAGKELARLVRQTQRNKGE